MDIIKLEQQAMALAAQQFARIDSITEHNQIKVRQAFRRNRVSETDFADSTGYGYGNPGRDKLDAIFAEVMGAEDALIRPAFVSGTHAITVALFGILRPGDEMLCITGKPYDTLVDVITGTNCGSLAEFGVKYTELPLLESGRVDEELLRKSLESKPKAAYIQKSRGYSLRPTLTNSEIEKLVGIIREISPTSVIMVDNCYGEFAELSEPASHSADLRAWISATSGAVMTGWPLTTVAGKA